MKAGEGVLSILPLYLISLAGRQFRGRTRIQKLVFLVQKELDDSFDYHFKPAEQGPLSYTLYKVLENLQWLGLVREIESKTPYGHVVICYELTNEGRAYLRFAMDRKDLPPSTKAAADKIYEKYADLPFLQLLETVHSDYPEFVG